MLSILKFPAQSDDFNTIETRGKKGVLPGGRRDDVENLLHWSQVLMLWGKHLFSSLDSQRISFQTFCLTFLHLKDTFLKPCAVRKLCSTFTPLIRCPHTFKDYMLIIVLSNWEFVTNLVSLVIKELCLMRINSRS